MSEVVRTGRAAWVVGKEELVAVTRRLPEPRSSFVSRAVVPLRVHGRVFGAISLSFRDARRFAPDERTFLEAIVQQAAYALDRARLHAAEQRARQNLDFLARASELLAQSLDVETTLQRLAAFAIPRLADWCTVDLLSDGEIRAVAVAHANPTKVELARELQRRHPADPDAPVGAPAVIRSGMSELHPTITEELLAAAAPDDEALEVIRDLGLVSAMVVPLRARERTLGALSLVAAESRRRFTSDDLEVAEDLARRAALAVENAMLYGREHQAAVTLQRSLLPRDLPRLRGLRLAARYLPAGVGADVGGDWYDTIDLADGRLNLVVGDVAGRGIRAASVMGQLRNALRAYVLDGCSPQEAVGRLNRLARTFESSEMATLVLPLVRPADAPGRVCPGRTSTTAPTAPERRGHRARHRGLAADRGKPGTLPDHDRPDRAREHGPHVHRRFGREARGWHQAGARQAEAGAASWASRAGTVFRFRPSCADPNGLRGRCRTAADAR